MIVPRLGATVRVTFPSGKTEDGVVVRIDDRKAELPAFVTVQTTPLEITHESSSFSFDQTHGMDVEILSEPVGSLMILYNVGCRMPVRLRAILADQSAVDAWCAEHRPDWREHGDIDSFPFPYEA